MTTSISAFSLDDINFAMFTILSENVFYKYLE